MTTLTSHAATIILPLTSGLEPLALRATERPPQFVLRCPDCDDDGYVVLRAGTAFDEPEYGPCPTCGEPDDTRCPKCGQVGTMKHGDPDDCRSPECLADEAERIMGS